MRVLMFILIVGGSDTKVSWVSNFDSLVTCEKAATKVEESKVRNVFVSATCISLGKSSGKWHRH